jgi:1-hydroxycarotenoid 3,4-desaturase
LAALRRHPAALLQLNPFDTLWRKIERSFGDPRLWQLFGRYATYCGSDPWQAPATLGMIAQVEADGVWLLEGGLHRLAGALASAAQTLGVHIHYHSRVAALELDHGGIAAVRLTNGGRCPTRRVVFNGDVGALTSGLLGPQVRSRLRADATARPSLSAVTWNLLATPQGAALSHHNVFFSADYGREFTDIFQKHRVPCEPTVYVCAQDRPDSGALSQADGERLLGLINAPALRDGAHDDDALPGGLETCEATMRRQLARCGLQLIDRAPAITTTPAQFAQLFPGSRGALYGAATHGWQAAFRRPQARTRIPGLYLAGGSVHPGPGLPMAALSGLHAADSLLADQNSRSRWRTTATRGGTSTSWAMIPPARSRLSSSSAASSRPTTPPPAAAHLRPPRDIAPST